MSVEALYQKHIQQLSIQERLELMRLLINSTLPITASQIGEKENGNNVMKLAGAGKAYAIKQDAQIHVRQMRS